MHETVPSQLSPENSAKRSLPDDQIQEASNSQPEVPETARSVPENLNTKRLKSEHERNQQIEKPNGIALIKPEYLISKPASAPYSITGNDSRAERVSSVENETIENSSIRGKKRLSKSQNKGQNKCRDFGSSNDAIRLCNSRANSSEFSPQECQFGDNCRLCHDLRKYLAEGRRDDLKTFGGKCPVYEVNGICDAGWKCRFVSSHSTEIERDDGRKELVLLENSDLKAKNDCKPRIGVYNSISTADKLSLAKRKTPTELSDQYLKWLDEDQKEMDKLSHRKNPDKEFEGSEMDLADLRSQFVDPPLRPSEKRKIYFGAETPILAPLTTQGNLPFRRMCVDFGAQLTYSEMAMTIPLIQGHKTEWALMKAHESEISPPKISTSLAFPGYENAKDLKFGAQISASKPWQAIKGAELLSKHLSHLRLIDLNCGCPIDLVYQSGAGSALLDVDSKLEKMIRGMNLVSGSTPITAKIRMGTKDNRPTAQKIIGRLSFGGKILRERFGAPGCAAITLHGRSRQQRYTKSADWSYIAECAALIKSYNKKKENLTDTTREPDERNQANSQKMFFIGNGDCYSHVDYYDHLQNSGVDSVMIARGALVKPWIFEEIEKGQYIDKSASERLSYVERFTRYGLDVWGSDEVGIGRTRKFLLEWLSFAHRYIPIGVLAHLPPSLNDRPPAYRGRDDMETMMASDDYQDWIKISEIFLGPAHKDFKFVPKHKSNSYEIKAEG
ncbi:tRNA-dihydrouridine synthase [Golovinomyces cichoracearum]|uniref:tRNA-dihydrouridine(47) synthase [NAD(P)(+)] n=1 Tax=Golovinomyces cichoracearum TaxID=62708 RepID=A0A420IHS9_9PEZI|nr:tRNA-dihydrouridine synthase [Golovinomyces cichoracearum]